jgi:hypothetical protein
MFGSLAWCLDVKCAALVACARLGMGYDGLESCAAWRLNCDGGGRNIASLLCCHPVGPCKEMWCDVHITHISMAGMAIAASSSVKEALA